MRPYHTLRPYVLFKGRIRKLSVMPPQTGGFCGQLAGRALAACRLRLGGQQLRVFGELRIVVREMLAGRLEMGELLGPQRRVGRGILAVARARGCGIVRRVRGTSASLRRRNTVRAPSSAACSASVKVAFASRSTSTTRHDDGGSRIVMGVLRIGTLTKVECRGEPGKSENGGLWLYSLTGDAT